MSMALKADVELACRAGGIEKPVDLAHLSSITMGDRKLELEILKMFSTQLPHFSNLIVNANTHDELQRAAHTVKGAARSIGAFKLANLTSRIEDTGKVDLQELHSEMDCISMYISEIS